MCFVSNVGDYWRDTLPKRYPWYPTESPYERQTVGEEEFDKVKRDLEALKLLLEAAKKFDTDTDQHHCQHDDKIALLKKMAKEFGVDLKDVLE